MASHPTGTQPGQKPPHKPHILLRVFFWIAAPSILSGGRRRSGPTQAYCLQLQGRNWTPRLILYNFCFIFGLKCSPAYLLWFTVVFLNLSMQKRGHDNFLTDILSSLTYHSALRSYHQRHYIRSGRNCNMGIWTMYSAVSSNSWPRWYTHRQTRSFLSKPWWPPTKNATL